MRIARLLVAVIIAAPFLFSQSRIDPRSGHLLITTTDLSLPAGAVTLDASRTLQGASSVGRLLGPSWRLNWDVTVVRVDRLAIVQDGGGTQYFSQQTENGYYRSSQGERLSFAGDGSAIRTRGDGTRDHYDIQGKLVSRDFRNGNTIRVQYTPAGRLLRLDGPKGVYLKFITSPAGLLAAVESSTGDRLEYDYASDQLSSVSLNGTLVASYAYSPSGNLTRIDEIESGPMEVTYDDRQRAVSRRWADGALERHEYGASENLYRLISPAGEITAFRWDGAGSTEEWTDSKGNRTVQRFDEQGRLVSVTGPGGSLTSYAYDSLGRISAVREGTTEPTSFTYHSDTSLITSITSPGHPPRLLEYDAQLNLAAVREGNRTLLEFVYYPDGLMRTVSRRGRLVNSFAYDDHGCLVADSDALGFTTRFECDAHGNVIREIDANGGITQWEYDNSSRLRSVVNAAGARTQFTYDPKGRLVSLTDPLGNVVQYDYDARNRLAAKTFADRKTRYQYDWRGELTSIVDPGNGITRFEYDASGNGLRVVNPLGGATVREVDSLGRVVSVTEPGKAKWQYQYSSSGALVGAVEPSGQAVQYTYDAKGQRDSVARTGQRATQLERDEEGRIVRIEFPSSATAAFKYDSVGNVIASEDSLGLGRRYEYDALDRLTREKHNTGLEIAYSYDPVGNLISIRDSTGASKEIQRDRAGRVIAAIGPGKAITSYKWDLADNLLELTDPLGHSTWISYTESGEPRTVTDPLGGVVTYQYDTAGRLTQVRNAVGSVWQFIYDAFDNLVSIVDPLNNKKQFAYDSASHVTAETAADGLTATFLYDVANRLVEARYSPDRVTGFRFDPSDNLERVDDGKFSVHYSRDASGRLSSIEYPAIGKSIQYGYDTASRLAKLTPADGKEVFYEYDAAGRPSSIRLSNGQRFSMSYDPANRLTSMTYPSGIKSTWKYDTRGLVTNLVYSNASGQVLCSWENTYDEAGRLAAIRDNADRKTEYKYDGADQLLQESTAEETTKYEYFPDGNRSKKEQGVTSTLSSYNRAGELTAAGEKSYRYDSNGNLAQRNGQGGIERFTWDQLGQLEKVTGTDGSEVSFGYSSTGERVWRRDQKGTTYFLTDGMHVLAELDEKLSPKATYVYGPGTDCPLSVEREGETYFYLLDPLGNVAGLTDARANVVVRYEYDGFGIIRKVSGNLENSLTFSGREWDQKIGLYYFRSRYYDPDSGRFLSRDPVVSDLFDPLSLNAYVYARNNPLSFWDPTGAYSWWRRSWDYFFPSEDGVNSIATEYGWGRGYRYDPNEPNSGVTNMVDQRVTIGSAATHPLQPSVMKLTFKHESVHVSQALRPANLGARAYGTGLPRAFPPHVPQVAPLQSAPGDIVGQIQELGGWVDPKSRGGWYTQMEGRYGVNAADALSEIEASAETARYGNQNGLWVTSSQEQAIQRQLARLEGNPAAQAEAQRILRRAAGGGPGQPPAPKFNQLKGRPQFDLSDRRKAMPSVDGVGASAARVAGAVGTAFTATTLFANHNACVAEGNDPKQCWATTCTTLMSMVAAGIIGAVVAAKILAAIGAAAVVAVPALVVGGLVMGGVAANEALDRWANAPEVETEQRKQFMYRDLLANFDKHVEKFNRDLSQLQAVREEAERACQELQIQAAEMSLLGVGARTGMDRLNALAATLRAGAAECERASAVRSEIEGLLPAAGELRQQVTDGLAAAAARAAVCRTLEDAAFIEQTYQNCQGFANQLRTLASAGADKGGPIEGVRQALQSPRDAMAELRDESDRLVDRAQSLSAEFPGKIERIRAIHTDYETGRQQILNRAERIQSLLPGDDIPARYAPQVQAAKASLVNILGEIRALPETLRCDYPEVADARLAAENLYGAVSNVVDEFRSSPCDNLDSVASLVAELESAAAAADGALSESESITESIVSCRALASGSTSSGGSGSKDPADNEPALVRASRPPSGGGDAGAPPLVAASTTGPVTPVTTPPEGQPKPQPAKPKVVVAVYFLTDDSISRQVGGREYRMLQTEPSVNASVRYSDGTEEIISGQEAFNACLRLGYYVRVSGLSNWVRSGMAFAVQPKRSSAKEQAEGNDESGESGGDVPQTKPPGSAGQGDGTSAGGGKSSGGQGLLGTEFESQYVPCMQEESEAVICDSDCILAGGDWETRMDCINRRCAQKHEARDRCQATQKERK
jgi:RHS repeat-associated protein